MPLKKKPPLYGIWVGLRQRCRNPNDLRYKHYGGRGINLCPTWESFAQFEADMGPRPPGMSIERIDNDGNYEPGNVRWATQREQLRNRRVTRWVTIASRRYKAIELAERAGLKVDTIVARARLGLSLEKVLSPIRRVYREGLALGGLANGARQQARKTCKNGHRFTAKNTHVTKQGWRVCRKCHSARVKAANARKRAMRKHMPQPRLDVRGLRFGRLVALREAKPAIISTSGQKQRRILVRCECGNETMVFLKNLTYGHTRSCGCLRRQR